MGRRALPKIDPEVDVSKHFFPLEEATPPFQPESFFENDGPLHFEMGSGKGLFLQTMSKAHPEDNFVGIEQAQKYARFSAYRLAKADAKNAIMFQGDGLRFFTEFLGDSIAESVHVYFPDPWWKDRHRKRRVLKESFVKDVQRVLKPGCRLHFWTDVKEYYDVTLELIAEVSTLDGPHPVQPKDATHTLDYRTHFERRTRLRELPVYRAEYIKPE